VAEAPPEQAGWLAGVRDPAVGGALALLTVSREVGYESEAACARAFKREAGLSPGAWRRDRRGRLQAS
jgi:AraC-like DNA-binding protein